MPLYEELMDWKQVVSIDNICLYVVQEGFFMLWSLDDKKHIFPREKYDMWPARLAQALVTCIYIAKLNCAV